MISLDTKKKAIALIALMMVSALAGCLGNDDDDSDDDKNNDQDNDNTGKTKKTPQKKCKTIRNGPTRTQKRSENDPNIL